MEQLAAKYLEYCKFQRALNEKTLQAYTVDLRQLTTFLSSQNRELDRSAIYDYISHLHAKYKPRSVKRKIMSIQTFCWYLVYEELIAQNPFKRINIRLQAPIILPRTIPLPDINAILSAAYTSYKEASTLHQQKAVLRDIAVIELLFATGARVAELCSPIR